MLPKRAVISVCLLFVLLVSLQIAVLAITVRTRNCPARSSSDGIRKRASSALSGSLGSLSTTAPTEFHSNKIPPNNKNNHTIAFSIVPASTNPSNKLTKQLLEDVLPNKLNAIDVRLLDQSNGGRLTFCVTRPSEKSSNTNDTTAAGLLDATKWREWLSPYGVKSLRLVLCECTLEEHKNDDNLPHNRQEWILKTLQANLFQEDDESLWAWKIFHESFGNTPRPRSSDTVMKSSSEPKNLEVSCRRWASSTAISKKEFSSTTMKHALRNLLLERYHHHQQQQQQQLHHPSKCESKTPSWLPRSLDDCEFTLLLYQNKLRLEWTVLVPPKSKKFTEADYLPKPGCKRVEAWMLMKNLEEIVMGQVRNRRARHPQRNPSHEYSSSHSNVNTREKEVIVLDPLCGKATFLVEAATTWNIGLDDNDGISISFVGIDASDAQLRDARRNVEAVSCRDNDKTDAIHNNKEDEESNGALVTRRVCHDQSGTIALYKGDSRDLSALGFEDGSVAAIATCPPFGRQFFALEEECDGGNTSSDKSKAETLLALSYQDWLREWTRILNPDTGRIALLVDTDHQEQALDAIASTGSLHVTVLREPFRLGRVRATVIVADVISPHTKNKKDTNNNTTAAAATSSSTTTTSTHTTTVPNPLSRFPWEGTAKETRAEWTRLRAASLQGLKPYTKVQRES